MILNQDRDTNTNQLDPETKAEALLSEPLSEESETPLYLKENDDSKKCDAQDEKDNTEE